MSAKMHFLSLVCVEPARLDCLLEMAARSSSANSDKYKNNLCFAALPYDLDYWVIYADVEVQGLPPTIQFEADDVESDPEHPLLLVCEGSGARLELPGHLYGRVDPMVDEVLAKHRDLLNCCLYDCLLSSHQLLVTDNNLLILCLLHTYRSSLIALRTLLRTSKGSKMEIIPVITVLILLV